VLPSMIRLKGGEFNLTRTIGSSFMFREIGDEHSTAVFDIFETIVVFSSGNQTKTNEKHTLMVRICNSDFTRVYIERLVLRFSHKKHFLQVTQYTVPTYV